MNSEECKAFIDCLTYEDCTIRLYDRVYWCLGLTYSEVTGLWTIGVYECEACTPVFIRQLFLYTSRRKDECMNHFLEERYWNGKSFYEVVSEITWVDL